MLENRIISCLVFVILVLWGSSCATKKGMPSPSPTKTIIPFNCVDSSYVADSSIMLNSKKILSLFGLKQYTPEGTVFSNLSIQECNKKKIYKLIATGRYLAMAQGDTLFLKQLVKLPVGLKFEEEEVCVLKEKLWFIQDSLQLKTITNVDFPSYSANQILDIFEEYQSMETQYNEKTELLMNKLFVSALSGNSLAVKTFKNFEAKFTALTGNSKMKYAELNALLKKYLEVK